MLNKILAGLSMLGAGLTAVFFVLFKQAKEERKAEEKKVENLDENLKAIMAGEAAEKELKKQNEELKKKVNSSNTLDSFNACNELLSKQ